MARLTKKHAPGVLCSTPPSKTATSPLTSSVVSSSDLQGTHTQGDSGLLKLGRQGKIVSLCKLQETVMSHFLKTSVANVGYEIALTQV